VASGHRAGAKFADVIGQDQERQRDDRADDDGEAELPDQDDRPDDGEHEFDAKREEHQAPTEGGLEHDVTAQRDRQCAPPLD
jgi:hypothetical protein